MNVLASEKRQWQERFNACCALHLNEHIQYCRLACHDCIGDRSRPSRFNKGGAEIAAYRLYQALQKLTDGSGAVFLPLAR